MRGRVIAVAAALTAALAVYVLRESGRPDRSSGGPDAARATPPMILAGDPSAAPSPSLRNVFEYVSAGSRPAAPVPSTAAVAPVAPAALAPPAAPPVRLVGLLRRGAQVKVALAITGETVVLASGESAGGYTVMAIDEDEGVRVRTPDGSTIVLVPTPDR
jgi:hypothetical protein